MSKNDVYAVLSAYPSEIRATAPIYLGGAGGFSGAAFWRWTGPVGPLCLRRWPNVHPNEERLRFIHDVLRHAGLTFVPLPIATVHGETFIRHQGHLWEVCPWMPGMADFDDKPSVCRLTAAMRALAEFHTRTCNFPLPVGGSCAVSPGIRSRYDQLTRLCNGEADRIRKAAEPTSGVEAFGQYIEPIISGFHTIKENVANELRENAEMPFALQPVIRDIWSQHVLFTGEEVTGIVDFGAMNIESPMADVARLLGSMAGNNDAWWVEGLAAYQSIRSVTADEVRLIRVFDRSTVVLSGMNWLNWIFVQKRHFENHEGVVGRLAATVRRLAHLRSN